MRILQILPHLERGGAERVVIELCNELSKNGHEVTILMISQVDINLNQKNLDSKVNVVFMMPIKKGRLNWVVRLAPWIRINRNFLKNFQVIHCHLTFGLIFGSFLYFLRSIHLFNMPKLIMTCHMVGMEGWPRFLNRLCSSLFDSFVLVGWNQDWRKFSEKKLKKNIYVIENGISVNKTKILSPDLVNKSSYRIGTISRLVSERRPMLLLQTFYEIKHMNSRDVNFIFGGEGPQLQFLVESLEDLDLKDCVKFFGFVNEPSEFLRDIDIYLTISVEKFPGIAALEAIFHGIPVLGIQIMPRYSQDGTDFIWSSQQPESVALKIIEFLSNPRLLKEYRQKQYNLAVKNYHVSLMTEKYLNVYKDCLSSQSET